MSTLILVVCLAASPNVCREEAIPVEGISCIVQGQLPAARWLDEHPKWLLKTWRCRVGGGKDA